MPLASACRCDTTGVQCLRNGPQGSCTRLLCLLDDGQDVRGVPVSFSLDHRNGILPGHVKPRVADGGTARLCGSKSLTWSAGDETQLFLCNGRDERKHRGI